MSRFRDKINNSAPYIIIAAVVSGALGGIGLADKLIYKPQIDELRYQFNIRKEIINDSLLLIIKIANNRITELNDTVLMLNQEISLIKNGIQPTGTIFISTSPPNANITKDGNKIGITNKTLFLLPIGKNKIKLEKDQLVKEIEIDVKLGKNKPIFVRLR